MVSFTPFFGDSYASNAGTFVILSKTVRFPYYIEKLVAVRSTYR